jgi:hypothetical protein
MSMGTAHTADIVRLLPSADATANRELFLHFCSMHSALRRKPSLARAQRAAGQAYRHPEAP